MSIQLLTIDGTDFTGWVNRRKFHVNHRDIYKEWEDINLRKHRDVVRREINGSAQLTFVSEDDYAAWAALANGTYHDMDVYVESLNRVETIRGFLSYTARTVRATTAFDEIVAIIVVECEIVER